MDKILTSVLGLLIAIFPSYAMASQDFALHLFSFRSRESALHQAAELTKEGRKAFVQSVDLGDKGRWFRACVGPFSSKAEALEAREELRQQGYEGYVGLIQLPAEKPLASLAEKKVATTFVPQPPEKRSITLQWDPAPENTLTGYRIYYGTSPGPPYKADPDKNLEEGPSPIEVEAHVNRVTLHGLKPATRYYFAVKAVAADGTESAFSEEVISGE